MHVELDTSFLRPLFGSARCWICRSLVVVLFPPFSYVYLFLSCLRLAFRLASLLLDAAATGLRARPFLLTLHLLSRFDTIQFRSLSGHRMFAYDAMRSVAGRTSTSFFSFSFSPLALFTA